MSRTINLRFVGYLAAVVIIAVGVGALISAGVSAIYDDPDMGALLFSTGICLVVGIPLYLSARSAARAYIGFREGFLGVVVAWLAAAVFGAIPFVLAGVFSPLDALFESVSGFTTTGASVMIDYDQPHGIMFWRSLTHWYGGMGIVVLFIALLPTVGGGAFRLFAAETTGPAPQRFTPRLKDTAKRLWLIYVGLSALQAIILLVLGVGAFGALTYTFGTMGTGGFAPSAASVGEFHSWSVELVITIFTVVAGGNFALYFAFISGRRRDIVRDPEFRLYLGILFVSTIAIAVSLLLARSHFSVIHALRDSMFQVVTIQSTTGFMTTDFDQWNTFAKTLLLGLMFVGGCAGSTAGGFKVVRFLVLSKDAARTLSQAARPRAVIPVRVGRRVVPDHVCSAVLSLFFLWVTVFVVCTLLLSTTNVSMVTAASAVAATLNNVGPGFELVGPTLGYAPIEPFGKVVLIAAMLLGRLELLALMLPFTRRFWSR